jgi:hypothetical protein
MDRNRAVSAVIILAAMVSVIVPAAIEFSQHTATATHHQMLTVAR